MEAFITAIKAIVDEYKQKKVIINRNGIYAKKNTEICITDDEIAERSENMYNACKLIPFCVTGTKRKGLVYSYGLKHLIEIYLHPNPYLSNGELILCMLYLGYEIASLRNSMINCDFKCSYANCDGISLDKRPHRYDENKMTPIDFLPVFPQNTFKLE
jgi:hypothetical protein